MKTIQIYFLVVLCVFPLISCKRQSDEINKGIEWLELKKYDNAISEFKLELNNNPKSEDARYYIAKSYLLKGNRFSVRKSIEWTRDLQEINNNNSHLDELKEKIHSIISYKLKKQDTYYQHGWLELARDYEPSSFIDEFVMVVAHGNDSDASMAIQLILNASPTKGVLLLEKILSSTNHPDRKLMIAKVLWKQFRSNPGADYIKLNRSVSFLDTKKKSYEVDSACKDLTTLPHGLVRDLFLKVFKEFPERSDQFNCAVEYLINHHDVGAANYALDVIKNKLSRDGICNQKMVPYVKLAGYSNSDDTSDILLSSLNNSFFCNRINNYQYPIKYAKSLSIVTRNDKWQTIPLFWKNVGYYYFGKKCRLVQYFLDENLDLKIKMFGKIDNRKIRVFPGRESVVAKQISRVQQKFIKKYTSPGMWQGTRGSNFNFVATKINFVSPDQVTIEGNIFNQKDRSLRNKIILQFRQGDDPVSGSKWLVYDFNVIH